MFIRVLAQLAFGLWHGFLAANKRLFHIKTRVSVWWNNTLWFLLVGCPVPGKGGGLCRFFWLVGLFCCSNLFLSESHSFVFCRLTNSEDHTESSCPLLENSKSCSRTFTWWQEVPMVEMSIFKIVFAGSALILLSVCATQIYIFIQSSFSFKCHI